MAPWLQSDTLAPSHPKWCLWAPPGSLSHRGSHVKLQKRPSWRCQHCPPSAPCGGSEAGSHALGWTLLCPLPFWTPAGPFRRGLLAPWLAERLCCWRGIEGSRRCPEQEVRRATGHPGGEPGAGGQGEGGNAERPPACTELSVAAPWVAQAVVLCGVKRKLQGGGSLLLRASTTAYTTHG